MPQCPICKSEALTVIQEEFRNQTKRDAYKCLSCELVFSSMAHEVTQEELDAFYEKEYLEHYYEGTKANIAQNFEDALDYQHVRLDRLRDVLPGINSLLEIGCGPGYFLHAAREHVSHLVGVEKNSQERQYVKDDLGLDCHESIADLENARFDCVVMNQVLEHTVAPVEFLKSHAALLNKGGYLIVEVPSMSNALVSLYECADFRKFWFQEPHIYYFSESPLRLVLEQVADPDEIAIELFQETSFANHFDWIRHGSKSKSRSVAISNALPFDIPNEQLASEISKNYEQFNEAYKGSLRKQGYGDYLLAIAKIH